MGKKTPDYCLHGHISDLIKKRTSDVETSQSDSWETISDGIKKQIKIQLHGMSKEVINWSQLDEGDLVFDREVLDLEGRRTLFIITEVIYAKKIQIQVSVDKETNETSFGKNKKIPIAFSYMKFPMDKHGVLKQAKDTDVKISASFEI